MNCDVIPDKGGLTTYEAFDIGLSEIPSVSAIRFEALCTEIQILAVNQVIGTSKK